MADKYIFATSSVTPGTVAHTANDVVGGLLTFNVAGAGAAVSGGVINSITAVDTDAEGAALSLYLFDGTVTSIAANAAFAPVATDLNRLVGKFDIAADDWGSVNGLKWVYKNDVTQVFNADKLYGYLVCSATPTYADAKTLTVRLGIITEG